LFYSITEKEIMTQELDGLGHYSKAPLQPETGRPTVDSKIATDSDNEGHEAD
jgi:hypothetical protein